jgi:hypothetical protein
MSTDKLNDNIQTYKETFRTLPYYRLKGMLNESNLDQEAIFVLNELIRERENKPRVPDEIEAAFYSGDLSKGVFFRLNDYVLILDKNHSGKNGSVISIVTMEPEATYLIELEDGRDVEINQSQIQSEK